MKKIIISIIIMCLLLFIGTQILTESNMILKSVVFSFQIWQNNIFPSLFPFFVLSELLQYYGFIELVSELCKGVMQKVFKLNGECAFILILSLISGFPSNAKYTRELYEKGLINEREGTKILTFTHFSNPLFILGTIALLFLNNKEVGLLILLCHYLGNIIIGLIFRNYDVSEPTHEKVSLKRAILKMHEKRMQHTENFGQMIVRTIMNTINTLLMILGIVTVFLVITSIISHLLPLGSYYQSLLNGFVEMTQGLKYVSILEIPLKLKAVLSVMIISFGGLSVHMQIFSILSDTKIKYLPFLTARIMHALISSFLLYISFDLWTYLL
ncbi:MAG: hypothetical protein PHN72_03690 [Bacilli bacterium]|nr:hypothetical protein [Bacilli bacterium]